MTLTTEPPQPIAAPGPPPDEPQPTLVVTLGVLIAVALSLGLLALITTEDGPVRGGPSPSVLVRDRAEQFLSAWREGDVDAVTALTVDPSPAVTEAYRGLLDDVQARVTSAEVGVVRVDGERATAAFEVDLAVRGLGEWTYEGTLQLAEVERPVGPAAEEAGGAEGEGGDGGGDGAGGEPELEPVWLVEWTPAAIHPSLRTGQRLGRERETPERAPVLAADGTPLTGTDPVSLPSLQGQVVGTAGTPSDDRAAAMGDRYVPGDTVGLSGLQAAFDEQLGGRASGAIVVLGADGERVRTLERFEGAPGEPVQTTFDPRLQGLAESTLGRTGQPAALVAIQASTGEVRAVASRPALGFNRAMVGRYPPGSTFKIVTATAVLASGTTPDTVVPCPAQADIDGRRFSNAGGEVLGDVPFRTDFFRSCNTAFVRLAADLDPAALVAAAESYGFNVDYDLPVLAVGGSFPPPEGTIDQASAGIGQGRVTASPLHMASVAAAVASGGWRPPQIIAGAPPVEPRAIDPGIASTLQELMRLVVSQGTGTAARLPGEPVAGKTGTAEFGSGNPPPTHAWFVGFRGDLAVAVVVENGGFGGTVAAPLAREFLAAVTG